MGAIFSSEQPKTKIEKERDVRQSYLATKHLNLIKDIQNKIMLLDVEHRNNQTLLSSLIQCMQANLNNLDNVQNSINDTTLLEGSYEEWKRKIIQEYSMYGNLFEDLFTELFPQISNIRWLISNIQGGLEDGAVFENAPLPENQQFKETYQIPNDENLIGRRIYVNLRASYIYPRVKNNNRHGPNPLNNIVDFDSDTITINTKLEHSDSDIKIIAPYNNGEMVGKVNDFLTVDTSNIGIKYSNEEIESFFEYINGRGDINEICDIKQKYRTYLINFKDTDTVKYSEKYRVVGIINLYDYLVDKLLELRKLIDKDKKYYSGKSGWISWLQSYIPYRSSNYTKYLEQVKIKDINDMTSNIGIKKSNLRNGKTNFLTYRKTLFSLLNENFRIPLKPTREQFNSDNEFQAALQKFATDSQYCKTLLEEKKNLLDRSKVTLATVTGASAILNENAN